MEVKYRDLSKKLEYELSASEERFRFISEQSIIGIGILQDNSIKYINEGASKINEYTIKEMEKWTIEDIAAVIHPEDSQFAIEQARRKQIGEIHVINNYEYRIITKSGKVKWIDQYSKTIIYNEKPAILSIWVDITEKKKREKEIGNIQAELITILNASGNAIRLIDKNFNTVKVNRAFIKLASKNENELEGRKCYDQFPHSKCHTPECTLERIRKGERFINIEVRKIRQDNSQIICDLKAKPFLDATGEFLGIVEVFKDVTKLKLLKMKLKESEKRYHQFIKDTLVGVWVIDSEYITTFVNSQMTQILGYQAEEMIGKTLFCFMENDDQVRARHNLKLQENQGLNIVVEHSFLHKNGTTVHTQLRTTPIIDEKDTFQGAFAFVSDITDQRRAEQELEISEERFKTLFKYLPVPTYVWKKNSEENSFILNDYNDAAFTITNGRVRDLLGAEAAEIYKDRPDIIQDLRDCFNRKGLITKEMDYTLYRGDGKKQFLVTYVFIPTDFVMIHTEDITQRKKIEKDLKESKRFLSNIFSSIQNGLCIIDKNYNVIRVNPTMKKWYPHMIPLEGKKCYQVYQHRNDPCIDCLCQQIYETCQPTIKIITRKGEKNEILGTLEIHTFPLLDQFTGKIKGVIEYIRDITEKIMWEKELKESEQKYRGILENITEGYFETDLDGNFTFFNKAFSNILKFPEEELIGKNYSEITDKRTSLKVFQAFNEVFNLELSKSNIEFEIMPKEGEKIHIQSSAYLLYDSMGTKRGFYGIIRDITEKKKAEEIIKQEIQKLKELDQLKTEFISRTSHELKTPLVSIISTSQLLLDLYADNFDKESQSLINIIKRGGERLENLTNNLLDVMQIESNKFELHKKKENLVSVIKESMEELEQLARLRNLKIIENLPEKSVIKIDSSKIRQVIMNILWNALKNTPPLGKVSLSLNEQKFYMEIKIKDSGVGFTTKEKMQIFKKFGKIERYGKGMNIDTDGSGLGLYISKEIVLAHRGKIWVESKGRNRGTNVIIRLPK